MKKFLFILLAGLLISGCTPTHELTREGRKIDDDLMNSIKTGITTREEIINDFGIPSEIVAVAGSEVLIYRYSETTVPVRTLGPLQIRQYPKVMKRAIEVTVRDGKVVSYRYKETTPN